ncbi:unnamed protein product, partial [Prorocentrum cordatum]
MRPAGLSDERCWHCRLPLRCRAEGENGGRYWHAQRCLSCRVRKFEAIHPNNKFRVAWDLLGVLILGHDLIMIPLVTFFENETVSLGRDYDAFKVKSDWFTASFWTADIAVSFVTGFHNSGGFVQRQSI